MTKILTRFVFVAFLLLPLLASMSHSSAVNHARAASAPTLPDACRLAPVFGECKAMLTIYYYDQERNACNKAFYGGCGGVAPFRELDECRAACETEQILRLHEASKGSETPEARLVISYPAQWEQPELLALVNEKTAAHIVVSERRSSERVLLELHVRLDDEKVRKLAVQARNDGQAYEAFTTVYW